MKKKVLALFEAFLAITLIINSVYAVVNSTINITASATDLKRGDVVTVTLSVANVDSEKPITSIAGYINYDKNVFETITVDSIQKSSDGTVTIGEETLYVEDLTDKDMSQMSDRTFFVGFNGKPTSGNQSRILIDLDKGIKNDTDVLKVDFVVKDNATTGEIRNAVKYDLFVITAGSENSSEISKSIDVRIQGEGSNNNTNVNNTNSNTNTNTNNNNTNTNSNTNNNNNTNTNTNSNSNTNNNNNTNKNTNSNTSTNKNTNKNTNSSGTNNNANGNKNSGNNSSSNANSSKGNSSSQNSGTKNDGTTANGNLPKTGTARIIIPGMIILSIAVISYFEYRKLKKNGI